MTDQNKTRSDVHDASPTATADAPTPPTKQHSADTAEPVVSQAAVSSSVKSGGKGLSLFAILLSLLALGGSGYNWYISQIQGKLDEAGVAVEVAQIGGQITRIGDSVTRLQNEQLKVVTQDHLSTKLLEASSAVDLKLRDVNQGQADLLSAVDKINQGLQTGVNQLAIDEISQLLKLGNNSALFANDKNLAIKALQLADEQLKELADPRYATVRRKINQEIGSLESVDPVDIESVVVKLKTLAKRIPGLKLENDTPVVGKLVIESEEQSEGFAANAKKVLSDLVDLVEVQRIDQAPKPLLVPEQRYFLDQNIELQLTKAELALLQERPKVYQDSLTAAGQMLSDYFDVRDANVKDVMAQIDTLKSQTFGSALPDISGSYAALKSVKGGQ